VRQRGSLEARVLLGGRSRLRGGGAAGDAQDLESLRATLCPLEREAMLEAAGRLVGFYLRTAPPLAIQQGIAYPADLEAVVIDKLQRWCGLHLDARTTEC
jgi:hypothetical protein